MPPLAAWKKPARSWSAPVNAPRRCPKNSDSISVSGIAPQLTATNGCGARAPSRWISRATSSLPEPDSPVIATGAMLRASRAMLSRTASMAGDAPMSVPSPGDGMPPTGRAAPASGSVTRAAVATGCAGRARGSKRVAAPGAPPSTTDCRSAERTSVRSATRPTGLDR